MARKRHLHPAQGVYPGFCLSQLTQHKVLPSFYLSQMTQHRGGSRPLSSLPTGRCCLVFPADRRCLFLQASAENHNLYPAHVCAFTRVHARTHTFFIGKKLCKLYTVAFKSLVFKHTRVYSWPPKLYTNCSPTLHKKPVAATAPTAHISSTGNGHVVGIIAPAFPEMLTRNRPIWFSAKNVLSLHCSGADLRQTRGCSGVFLQSMVLQKASRGISQAALGENYKALGQNYKALSKNYKALGQKHKGGSSPREGFRRRKSVAKMLPKVINVNATMHFGPSTAYRRPPAGLLRARGLLPHRPLPLQESCTPQLHFTPTCLARINGNYYLCRNLFHTQQNNQQ